MAARRDHRPSQGELRCAVACLGHQRPQGARRRRPARAATWSAAASCAASRCGASSPTSAAGGVTSRSRSGSCSASSSGTATPAPEGSRRHDITENARGTRVPGRRLTQEQHMKQVAQNYRSGELSVLDVPNQRASPGACPRPHALLPHLDRHRDDEGDRGTALAARQGAGTSRPGQEGARLDGPAGPGRDVQEGDQQARQLHPARLLAVRRGRRGRGGRRGVRRR